MGQTGGSTGRGERCNNPDYQEGFLRFKELGLPVKEVQDKAKAVGKTLPVNRQGVKMCLSYHVLGFCWSNCGKAADHQTPAPTDTQKLMNWCRECYQAGGPSK